MPYQSPINAFGSSIIFLTNPETELRRMELTFRSVIMDKDGKTETVGDPLMNELGINSVIGQVQSIVNRVTIMSSLDKHEVPMLIDFLGDTLAKDLMMNRLRYAIGASSSRDKIYFTALSNAFICMKRASAESISDKKFWKGSQQDVTHTLKSDKKDGGMSKVLGWGKS